MRSTTFVLVAALLLALPVAAAVPGACETAACVASGNHNRCADSSPASSEWNVASVHVAAANKEAGASVQTFCFTMETEWFTYSYTEVRGSVFVVDHDSGTSGVAGFLWSDGTMNGSSNCQTMTYTTATGSAYHGCPAGGPPTVPALLP